MTSRVPTEKQYRTLLELGSGSAFVWVSNTNRVVAALIKNGWAASEPFIFNGRAGHSMVRITPNGFRALAVAVERYGLPELRGKGSVA